jgi:hypothetical protein
MKKRIKQLRAKLKRKWRVIKHILGFIWYMMNPKNYKEKE